MSAIETEMKVRVTNVSPKQNKQANLVYPYETLEHGSYTYRGYPVTGKKAFKNSKWRIQIVSPQCLGPSEPLPQFPQQEVLVCENGFYRGDGHLKLSNEEVNNNCGEGLLKPNDARPTSQYFFTAGYTKNSAVRLKKPEEHSIYHKFAAGEPVAVQVIDEYK